MFWEILNLPTKEYITGIDKNSLIETKTLNVFQVILRRFFGLYSETHSKMVIRRILRNIFCDGFSFKEDSTGKISKLFRTLIPKNNEPKFYSDRFCIYDENSKENINYSGYFEEGRFNLAVKNKDGKTVSLSLTLKDSNSLNLYDLIGSSEIMESLSESPLFHHLFSFLRKSLQDSQHVKKIYFDSHLLKTFPDIVEKENDDLMILKHSKCTVEASNQYLPSIPLDFIFWLQQKN